MNKVVANSVTLLRPLIGEDIELVVRLAPNALCVRADQYQMDQILMNLAVNARDAMPGGGKLRLRTAAADGCAGGGGSAQGSASAGRIDASVPGGGESITGDVEPASGTALPEKFPAGLPNGTWVLLTVQDDGVGMSEETQEHVFEPFFTTKDEGKGSGLGLSTVYGIVTQSAGRIQVESAPGSGSTFTVALPDRAPAERAAPSRRSTSGTCGRAAARSCWWRTRRTSGSSPGRSWNAAATWSSPVASAREALLVAEGSTTLDMRGHRRGDAGRHERRGDGGAPLTVPAEAARCSTCPATRKT